MIQELVELSARIPKNSLAHDALDTVLFSIDCVIDSKGNFKQFIIHEKQSTLAERITAKKGKARLLVDKPEEVLGWGENAEKKHQLFREKLYAYKDIKELFPVIEFYSKNESEGVQKAKNFFDKEVDEKQRQGNIAFLLEGDSNRIHERDTIYGAIILNYEKSLLQIKNLRFERCSICGSTSYPIADVPHGMIKKIPEGQTSGCALISYNEKAYESYHLKGNENSSVCTRCAKAYVDSLNWLLSNGSSTLDEKGKQRFHYKNRKPISNDTAFVFWLRNAVETNLLDILDDPTEENVHALFDAIHKGRQSAVTEYQPDVFYAITLSGAAARIFVRNWLETNLEDLRTNLAKWFQDIEVGQYEPVEKIITNRYPRFVSLIRNVKGKSDNDVQHGRTGAVLLQCALRGDSPPLWLINLVLRRIRLEQGKITAERFALLKLYMNRKITNQKGILYMATLDESHGNIAYQCGRLFSVLESIQYHASGGELNAGIRQRFFSFASTMPSTAFGRLMKLSQHHLTKIQKEKPGLAINLDKKIQELMTKITETRFPAVFSLEEQASFAIGYYHQRQQDFQTTPIKKEN